MVRELHFELEELVWLETAMHTFRWCLHRAVLENVKEIHHMVHVFDNKVDCVIVKDNRHTLPAIEQIVMLAQLHRLARNELVSTCKVPSSR